MTIIQLPGPSALVFLSALAMSACRMPTAADEADILANLRFSPGAFDSFRRNTEILYTLKHPARVTFAVVRRLDSGVDQPVLTLFTGLMESRGYHSHTWLGDTSQGLFAPAGDYIGVVQVEDRRFEAAVRVFHY
jgi:hypothetical protein